MEEMIRDECLCLAENLRSLDGLEVDTKQLFNLSVMNILWRMISGSRYTILEFLTLFKAVIYSNYEFGSSDSLFSDLI